MEIDLDEASKHLLTVPRRTSPAQKVCPELRRPRRGKKLSRPTPYCQTLTPAIKEPGRALPRAPRWHVN
jgi:hypothetical protein